VSATSSTTLQPRVVAPKSKSPLKLHFCALGMYWNEAKGECMKNGEQ